VAAKVARGCRATAAQSASCAGKFATVREAKLARQPTALAIVSQCRVARLAARRRMDRAIGRSHAGRFRLFIRPLEDGGLDRPVALEFAVDARLRFPG
jgi:hypothetical protein